MVYIVGELSPEGSVLSAVLVIGINPTLNQAALNGTLALQLPQAPPSLPHKRRFLAEVEFRIQ